MKTGFTKWFDSVKGYGFIKEDESEKEYFVHSTGLVDKINENDRVSFDLVEGKKGMNCVNVQLIED